jgi:mevalonate kinase
MPALSATAPAKTILFGEHAVVYQRPAIAIPISNLRTKINILANPKNNSGDVLIEAPEINFKKHLYELTSDNPFQVAMKTVTEFFHLDHFPSCEIMITSTVPIASGLGSSASTAVALIRGLVLFLGQQLDDQTISDLAFQVEKIHHGNPSGIDNTVVALEKPVFFIKQTPIKIIKVKLPLNFILGDTGIHSLTKEVVSAVREKWITNTEKYEKIFDEIGKISKSAKSAIELGNIHKIGEMMNENHLLLKQLDVSCDELDILTNAALKAGALGAKLCGSGRGGNMIALINEENRSQVQNALKSAGAINSYFTQILPSR